jgi:hypothetical protein
VRISKCWVDLDGSSVALESSLDVLHFLQSIAHVAVSICKCWLDSTKRKSHQYQDDKMQKGTGDIRALKLPGDA